MNASPVIGHRSGAVSRLLGAVLAAAVLLGAAPAAEAARFLKEGASASSPPPASVTLDWGVPGGPGTPATASCMEPNLRNGELCDADPLGTGYAPTDTGDADACSGFGWNTGSPEDHDGIYGAWRSDGGGPRGAGRNYWAVCVKDGGKGLGGVSNDVAFASARYSFDLDDHVPPGHVASDARLVLNYTADADDFNEWESLAVLYAFIRDADTGRYYKLRGGQSGAVNGDRNALHGCDYVAAWDVDLGDPGESEHQWSCGSGGAAKPDPDMEAPGDRTLEAVCAANATSVSPGQTFSYGSGRCSDPVPLGDFLNGKAASSRRFEILVRLVVRTNPNSLGIEKFALALDARLDLQTRLALRTPRYGASFSYGSAVPLVCSGAPGATFTFRARDHNRFADEFTIATVADADRDGIAVATWDTSPPVNGIDSMTGWWVRCEEGGRSDHTKIYLINRDPEVYLRGRAYHAFLPCVGVDITEPRPPGGYDCIDIRGNAEASTGDHDEDQCEEGCDLADEPGKLWITIKLGKRGRGCSPPACYPTSRSPVDGNSFWNGSSLAQVALLGCTSEASCAPENTAGSFRLAQENQQGDGARHCPGDDINGDGVPDLSPSYNGGRCDEAGDHDRDDGRRREGNELRYFPNVADGLAGSDGDTHARAVPNCWSEMPPTNDWNLGTAWSGNHNDWRGGRNDCEFMTGRWAKFLFGAASFRGSGTVSSDGFWWTAGLWLDDRHVFALGAHATTAVCAPSRNTGHDTAVRLGFHGSCMPDLGEVSSPRLATNLKFWVANSVEGCDSWTSCSAITSLSGYVRRSLDSWNRFTANLMDDLANLSETYPDGGGPASITALATHALKIFGEPTNPRRVAVGGGPCSSPGVAMVPPSNPGGLLHNLLRVSAAVNHGANDPFSIGADTGIGCAHSAVGDTRPAIRDGAALVLPAAAYLIQDKRDQWFIRLNDPSVRPALDGLLRNISLNYARAVGPPNGSGGLNYLWRGLAGADPGAWSDALSAWLELSRDSNFVGGVLPREQFARGFHPASRAGPTCREGPDGHPRSGCNWGEGVNATMNHRSTVDFLASLLDLATLGVQHYNLYLRQMNDENSSTLKANAEARWGHTYRLLKVANTLFDRMPQDRFNALLEERTRWVAINNFGNPGWVDYLGAARGPAGGCGNWLYNRSAHTTPDGDSDDNDLHDHDTTAHTNNRGHPMQFRHNLLYIAEVGNPVKQDAGYASLDSGWNYLLCRLQYVNDETYKNLADALVESVSGLYKSFWAMVRQGGLQAGGPEPSVSDFSTQSIRFLTRYLDLYRVRPAALLYNDTLLQEQSDELGFAGNNDYFFDHMQPTAINGENTGRFSCNDGAASAGRCRERYFYERAGANLFLHRFVAKLLENIDLRPEGALHNLTRLRVERAADLMGDPRGTGGGLAYLLNHGRSADPGALREFARVLAEWAPLYMGLRLDAADGEFRLPPEQRLEMEEARLRLRTFASHGFGEWGDLMLDLRGLKGEYFAWHGAHPPSDPFPEPPYLLRTDGALDFSWPAGSSPGPALPPAFSARWTGEVEIPAPREVRFQVCADDGVNFTLDGRRVLSAWVTQGFTCYNHSAFLPAGFHGILVEYFNAGPLGPGAVALRWNATSDNPTCRVDGALPPCPAVPRERLHPPYAHDHALRAPGLFRWSLAALNTLYDSFTLQQHVAIARAVAENAHRYFGDMDGCSGRTGAVHVQMGRQNGRCPRPPAARGVGDLLREAREADSRALAVLFRVLGIAMEGLPGALSDPQAAADSALFLGNAADAARNLLDAVNALPEARRDALYDRYWASVLWDLRRFRNSTELAGAGLAAGPLALPATQGQIGSAGAELARNLDLILGDAQARSGMGYWLASLRAGDESELQGLADRLLEALRAYVRFSAERAARFPAVVVPAWESNSSVGEFSELSLFRRARSADGLRHLFDPLNEARGLWGRYYDLRNLKGALYVASDDGAACSLTTSQGTALDLFGPGSLNDSHGIFSGRSGDGWWDYRADLSAALRAGPVLVACQVRNVGGLAGFDAALKVGSRFRVQRSDDDANHRATGLGQVPQISGCGTRGANYCYTRDPDCASNEVWRYSAARPAWWPAASHNIGDEINTQDLTDGTAGYAPFARTSESWGCTNTMPSPGDLYVWKRIEIDPFEEGELTVFRNDPAVDFCFGGGACEGGPDPGRLGADHFAVRWSGKLDVPATRDWRLRVCADDGARLSVDGVLRVDDWSDHGFRCRDWDGPLEAGLHDLRLDYYERTGTARVSLQWNLTGGCCRAVSGDHLYTRDPAQHNRSARSLFGAVYGGAGALNGLYALASKAALQNLFDAAASLLPGSWTSFGGVFGRSYATRHGALNSSLDPLRDDHARATLPLYRDLVLFASKAGEQAPRALPDAASGGFVRLWDFALPSSLSAAEKDDLCKLATHGLSPGARRFYYFGEDGYPESWTSKPLRLDVASFLASSCAAGSFINITNASALRGHMQNNSANSVIVMLKDVCPDTVCDVPLPNAAVYYDTNYPTSWIGAAQARRIADFFNQTGARDPLTDPRNSPGTPCDGSSPCGRTFWRMNAAQLKEWMGNLITRDRARGSVVVFAQDVCPDTVCENMTLDSTIARYLGAGGRVVWLGDVPFRDQGIAGGGNVTWGAAGQKAILGVTCNDANRTTADCFPPGAAVVRSAEAARWGMTRDWNSVRPVSYHLVDAGFTAKYWNTFNSGVYSSAPAVVRSESALDFDWRRCPPWSHDCDPGYTAYPPGVGSPDRSLASDSFASEWTGTFYQPANGTVTFRSEGDDSRGLRVGSTTVFDPDGLFAGAASCAGDTSVRTGTVSLARGFHTLVFRHCERGGDAAATLQAEGPGWPGRAGLKSVRAETGTSVLAHHPRAGEPTLVTNISAFHRNFNPAVPDSGFVRVWDCRPGGGADTGCGWDLAGSPANDHPLLRDLWNISTRNLAVEVHGGHLSTGSTGGEPYRVPDINVAGDDSLLVDYMRRGGRVVWIGDIPAHYQGHGDSTRSFWGHAGERKLLGVRTAGFADAERCGAAAGRCTARTWEGFKAGLAPDSAVATDAGRRPTYVRDVTHAYRKDAGDNASWWSKEFNDSAVSYKRRTTEFWTNVLDGFTRFLGALESTGDWERKLTAYWADRYWTQAEAVATYRSWLRQPDLLHQLGTDSANSSATLAGRSGSEGLAYLWRSGVDVDWTAGRGPRARALLDFGNRYFGLLAGLMSNRSDSHGLGAVIRGDNLSLANLAPGVTGRWTGVIQAEGDSNPNKRLYVYEWQTAYTGAPVETWRFHAPGCRGGFDVTQDSTAILVNGAPLAASPGAASGRVHTYKAAYDAVSGSVYVYRDDRHVGNTRVGSLPAGDCVAREAASGSHLRWLKAAPGRWDPPLDGSPLNRTGFQGCTNLVLDACAVRRPAACPGGGTVDFVAVNRSVVRPSETVRATVTYGACGTSDNASISYDPGSGRQSAFFASMCAPGDVRTDFAVHGNPGVHRVRGSVGAPGPLVCGSDNDEEVFWVAEPVRG